ncbi:FAD-binding oxidoreductase [Aspergillus fijiensis CBS 313.89]|uniref:FAD binding domain protein n=1 Tax=Aspergillus fijiensis CBS 313.89 TaxID=1448319 RepID=A0A8G1RNY9_9EURO|nr:FAD binding domain protein [Aspergillus fijiensis CBS 313.89]RAK77527.1 FAD binding domain protein [Aspergillus fijiensis CBS 313.89]
MDIIWRDTCSAALYEGACLARVFNSRRPDQHPAAIVRARTESDIIEAVQLVRNSNLQITVRSGGHSFPAWSLRENSLLIDLGDYREVEVDAERKEAWISSGMKSDIDLQLMKDHGLMLGAGHHPGVGIGGYLLQGGLSWNCRNWGWACERVRAVDVVTADGSLVRCSAEENRDLFWAARGAGPYFPGIATRFLVQLLPAPMVFRSSGYIYPKNRYTEAFNWILALTPAFDKDTEIVAVCRYPDGIDETCFTVYFITMKDSVDAAWSALLPAQQTRPEGTIQEWFCREDSLEQEYANEVSAYPGDRRWVVDNAFIENEADLAAVLEQICLSLPDRRFVVLWYPLAPQSRRRLSDMAFSLQSDHYVGTYAIYESESDDERCRSWIQDTAEKLEPFRVGSFSGEADFQARVVKCWADKEFERLTQVRQRRDPEGRFCGPLAGVDA